MQVEVTSPVESEIKKWMPFPKQEKFITLPFDFFEGFFGGVKGPGKSEILVLLPILYGLHNNPNYRGLYMRRTFTDIEREITDRQRKYYPSTGAVYNEQKHRWKWPNGAIDRQGHSEHEKDIRNYDTDEYHLLRWDELTHFTYFPYQYLSFTRVRSSDPFLPAIVRSSGNPGNIGNAWVYDRFIRPAPFGHTRIREKVKDPRDGQWKTLSRIYIPADITDNPAIDPQYYLKIQMLPEAERRAALGDWFAFAGQVFTEWRLEPIGDEPANAKHVIKREEQFPIPSWWPKVIAIDWGWEAGTCIGWGAISPQGQVFLYRTYNEKAKYISEWVRDLINLSGSEIESVRKVKICHSAVQHRGEPKTIQEQVQEEFDKQGIKISVELGKKDRIGGKMLVHSFLRWKTIPQKLLLSAYNDEYAQKINRMIGPKAYDDYVKQFMPENPEVLPRLQVFEGAADHVINVIPQCSYEQKENKNTEDVAEFKGDDPYDMLRMLLESVDEYVEECSSEMEQQKTVDAAVKRFVETQDATAFYRNMEHIEQQHKIIKAVRRRSFRRR